MMRQFSNNYNEDADDSVGDIGQSDGANDTIRFIFQLLTPLRNVVRFYKLTCLRNITKNSCSLKQEESIQYNGSRPSRKFLNK